MADRELQDYDAAASLLGRVIEKITHYRARTQRHLKDDRQHLVTQYHTQQVGKMIRRQ